MNKNLIILSIAVVAVLIGGYNLLSGSKLGVKNNTLTAAIANQNQQNQVMFSVDAKRWQFTPDVIRVKKGQQVKIIINNTDTIHGINLLDFNAIGDDSIEFTADKTGEFVFRCNNFCGDGHGAMQGKIIVTK
ncbi:MAG: cupredoxin domain-containing protein [Patescibacteria group bacterium]